MPTNLAGVEKLHIFIVPTASFLGDSEFDYSKVKVRVFNQKFEDITAECPDDVAYFSTGRVGALNGGLLHTADCRQMLSRLDIVDAQKSDFEQVVAAQQDIVVQEQNRVDQKRKIREERTQEHQERLENWTKKSETCAEECTAWKALWSKLLALGESGPTRASEDQTWKEFCISIVTEGEEHVESTCPVSLYSATLPWSDVLLAVATHVSKLESTQQLTKKRIVKVTKILENREKVTDKKQKAMVRRIDSMHDGEKKEMNRKLVPNFMTINIARSTEYYVSLESVFFDNRFC